MRQLNDFFKALWPRKKSVSKFQMLRNQQDASPSLQQQLIDRVGGDREEAEKRVARARFGTQGQSEAYYWWKAIQYLEQQEQHNDDSQ